MAIFTYISIHELSYDLIENRSQVIYAKDGSIISYTLSKDSETYRFYTKIEDVDPLYIDMLIANEDKRFYEHCGVDILSLFRAIFGNISSNKIVSGGSTIPMQVAKMLSRHRDRTYINKLKELIQAIYITQKFGHKQVLEWYLTIAPFGGNIEGVKAASLRWFNHMPNKLTPSEAALLTALPRSPELIRPDRHYKQAIFYKNDVLRLSYEKQVISKDVWDLSIEDELPTKLYPIRQIDRTLSNYLGNSKYSKYSKNASAENVREYYTNLEPSIENILLETKDSFNSKQNGSAVLSVVVLDSSSHNIVGFLGSSNTSISEICLPFSLRSPGSTLKPFAYALAFQERKLHPNTILHDNMKLLGYWKPNNFNYEFSGKILAQDALRRSLNLPALEVINLIGAHHFYNFINSKEQRLFVYNNQIDQSLILGSGVISQIELAKLFAMLNEDGIYHHFSLLTNEVQTESFRFLADDVARATFNILKKTNRPNNGLKLTEVSYKTGTSSKFMDALAIGSLNNYTVAVAIRIPNNRGDYHKYSGFADAAPHLFEILDKLPPNVVTKPTIESELLEDNPPAILKEIFAENSFIDDKALKISFPINNSVIMPDHNGKVFIKYIGGEGNIYFNVNNEQSLEDFFIPHQSGKYTISILDEYGHSDSVKVNVVIDDEEDIGDM